MAKPDFRPDGKKMLFGISFILTLIKEIERYSGIQRVVAELFAAYADLVGPENLYIAWGEGNASGLQCVPFDRVGGDVIVDP